MASVQTSAYSGRYLKLTVVEESTSISANTSTVRWTLESIGGSSTYYTIYNCSVVVNGQTVYNSGTTNWDKKVFPAKTGSTTGTITVPHNNDGTASAIGFTLHGKVYVSGDENKSGTLPLSTIPRYAGITKFDIYASNETTIHVDWNADNTCDAVQYSVDGGGWVGTGGLGFNIGGLSANAQHSVKIRVKRADSQLWTESGVKYATTYDYPKPTSINNFVIGNGASVNLYNPLGRNVTLQILQVGTNTILGTYSGTYNGVVNAEFKTADAISRQYASIPNSNSGTYYAKVTYGAITKTYGNATYSTNTAECSPSFSSFNVKDNNSSVVDVTGNNQVFVKGKSTLYVMIPSANKMTTQKSATPSSYGLGCDTLSQNVAYSDNDINVSMGTLTNAGTLRVNVRAYDSRSNSALAYKDITVYDYAKPVINIVATRLNNFENETTVKISGTYTRLTINNTDKNTITNVKYRYRETGGTWSGWTNLTTSVVSGKFTCNDVILSLDNTKSFEFEVQATDKLDSNTNTASVSIGQAIFFVSSNKRACYINGQEIIMYDVVDEW